MPLAVLPGDQFRDKNKRSGNRIITVMESSDRLGKVSTDPNPFYGIVTIKSDKPTAVGRMSWIRRATLLDRFVYLPKGSPSYVKTGQP